MTGPSQALDEVRHALEFQAIEDLLAAPVAGDDARLAENVQVLRRCGPAEPYCANEIADAMLAIPQRANERQARWDAQRLEYPVG
jgi:hypothetical protein